MIKLTLYGDVPSKKNSKQLFKKEGMKKIIAIPSKNYSLWYKSCKVQLQSQRKLLQPIANYPVDILYFFYASTNRISDYSNKIESINDFLVEQGILTDDSTRYVRPFPLIWVKDKCARVEIELYESNETVALIERITGVLNKNEISKLS